MDLHRIEGAPQWQSVPPAKRNPWQRTAARTNGIVTIGNLLSLIGLFLTMYGLQLIIAGGRPLRGVFVILLGRFCDVADGYLAAKTATMSPLGEKVDAVFDKISIGLVLLLLSLFGILPWWVTMVLVLPHMIVGVLSLILYARGKLLHPSRTGKLTMFTSWGVVAGYIYADTLPGDSAQALFVVTTLLVAAAAVLGTVATAGYIAEFRRKYRGA